MTRDIALLELLNYLTGRGYRFVTVTPATHARVVGRENSDAPTLRDIFGWSRSFREDQLDTDLLAVMRRAEILEPVAQGWRSALRVSSLGEDLFLHSAYPTEQPDAVFFGPDTYRFAAFIGVQAGRPAPTSIVDMGAGSGAGGIHAARLFPHARVTLVDTNPAALALARINACAAGIEVETVEGRTIPAGADLVLANPPYLMDEGERTYRDGGGLFGGDVALAWTRDALGKLAPGGTMLLYTGAAVVAGDTPLTDELALACKQAGAAMSVTELDPDVFGEELDRPAYADVERIAAIGVVIRAAG